MENHGENKSLIRRALMTLVECLESVLLSYYTSYPNHPPKVVADIKINRNIFGKTEILHLEINRQPVKTLGHDRID